MNRIINRDISKIVAILEGLGFEINHMDSSVSHPSIDYMVFDFSATDETMFIYSALKQMESAAFKRGRNSIRSELNNIMVIED